jgi:tRNA-Thr(GGU) m(6)t(6)A37 methyltransferase TsaA
MQQLSDQRTNSNQSITLRPIGVIHSPHTQAKETPIQPVYARGVEGTAEIWPEYADGLRDLEGFSHIYLIYHFHEAKHTQLIVKPFLQDVPRGVFATRAPRRPNPIGFSVVRLVSIEGNMLHLEDVDVLDGTPLLDIKPYITRFDHRENVRCGWQEGIDDRTAQARGRRRYGENSEDA